MSVDVLDFKVVKVHRLPEGKVKAFVDVGVNDALLIKGVRVVDGDNGLFVCMPQEQGKNERWYEKVQCLNKEVRSHLQEKVLEAYKTT